MTTVEMLESEYLALLDENKKLKEKIDKLEGFLFHVLKEADTLIKDNIIS